MGDTAASKELWGAGVRSTKAAQLHSIGQLAGWVGSCVLGTAKHGLGLATASPQHLKAHRQSYCRALILFYNIRAFII